MSSTVRPAYAAFSASRETERKPSLLSFLFETQELALWPPPYSSCRLPPNGHFCEVKVRHLNTGKGRLMKFRVLVASVAISMLAVPVVAHAQGVPGGVAHGVYEGNRRAGPVGAVVGGAVGGVLGGIEGVLGVDRQYSSTVEVPRRHYRQRRVVRKGVRHSRRVHHSTRYSQSRYSQ
jgi:hypothetical protein